MGLINLLSIAVRLLTLIEFVVRRQLKQNQEQLDVRLDRKQSAEGHR